MVAPRLTSQTAILTQLCQFRFDPNEADMYQFARGGRRPIVQRFDEYYRCYPMAMAPGPERPTLNYGSKIFLPPSALDKVSRLHVQWPLIMELVNGEKGKHSHAGVLEFVAEEGKAYLPHWVCFGFEALPTCSLTTRR
jgi:ubiquitin fusion degradation protein 1